MRVWSPRRPTHLKTRLAPLECKRLWYQPGRGAAARSPVLLPANLFESDASARRMALRSLPSTLPNQPRRWRRRVPLPNTSRLPKRIARSLLALSRAHVRGALQCPPHIPMHCEYRESASPPSFAREPEAGQRFQIRGPSLDEPATEPTG